jgi:uncharacterized membrane protein YoaK (UPF0700 family)
LAFPLWLSWAVIILSLGINALAIVSLVLAMLPISKIENNLIRAIHGSIVPGTSMIGKLSKYALVANPNWQDEQIYFGENKDTRDMPIGN